MTVQNAIVFQPLGIASVKNIDRKQNTDTGTNQGLIMTKYKIIKEPSQQIFVSSFEAEASFEGTANDEKEVTINSSGVKLPSDCCKAISENKAKEEEEKWVLSEYF